MMVAVLQSRTPNGAGSSMSRKLSVCPKCLGVCITTARRQITASCSWPRGFKRRPRLHPNLTVSRSVLEAPGCPTAVRIIQMYGNVTRWRAGLVVGCLSTSPGYRSTTKNTGDTGCQSAVLYPLSSPHRLSPSTIRPRPQRHPGPPVSPTWILWRWRTSPWTCWQSPSERAARTKASSERRDEYVLWVLVTAYKYMFNKIL